MDWQRIVGENIRRLRVERGASQEDVAGGAGLDVGYFGKIERGRRNPSLKKLISIAGALKVSLDLFFVKPKQ